MDDVREVRAELQRLAEAEALEPFDTDGLLARGRRGRRRRTVLAAGAAISGVAVVALVVSLIPGGSVADKEPGFAGDQNQNSQFEAVPGIERGEAAAGQTITKEEAVRRCALRYPDHKQALQAAGSVKAGSTAMYAFEMGARFAACTIPGGDKPKAELVAAAEKEPLPTTAAGQLRNCSVQLWVDLTGWRVMAADQSARLGTTVLVAISPSGKKAVACELAPRTAGEPMPGATPFLTLNALGDKDPVLTPGKGAKHAELFVASGGGGGHCPGTPCTKQYNYTGWGRVSSTATKVRLELGPGPTHDVEVVDGWFAFTWLSPGPATKVSAPKLTAYDKAGKVVKVIR
ncbi:hypothetical protein AB0H36_41085 [Kribbella sp. NPDC050820]|uniref:hypothetical protein n=1 Tax=Kribbella sp. NPDC050820 TaxID=3155408 RepID=UPI0033F0D6D3